MLDAAWSRARLSYAGWVPNVGSHLSFSLIGSRAGDGVLRLSDRIEHKDRIARVVCALQERTTDDMLSPPRRARRKHPDLRQDWLLVGETETVDVPTGVERAKPEQASFVDLLLRRPCGPREPVERVITSSDEQGALVGRILVIPYEKNDYARAQQEAMLAAVRRRLSDAARNRGSAAVIKAIESQVRAASPGLCTINFTLMRTGEARLWFEAEHPSLDDGEHEQLAMQAYFFLKDMSHRHVHHDHLDDQITPLIRFNNENADKRRASEIAWRRETLWSLSRIADKRMGSGKLIDLREALGMLAYADAFQNSLLPYVRDPENALVYHPNKSAYGFDFQHIRESTRVRIDQTAARRTVTGQLIAALFAGAIASISLLSSLVSTHNGAKPNEKYAISVWDWLLRWLSDYPVAVMAISSYILYSAFALTLSDILFTRPRRRHQALRGWTLSKAKKDDLTPGQAYHLLVEVYIGLISILFVGLIALTVLISRLPDDLGLCALRLIIDRVIAAFPIC